MAPKICGPFFSQEIVVTSVVKNENITLTGIGFNLSEKFSLLAENKPVDLVYTIDENEWNGETHLQLKVIDFRLSG